MVRALLCVKDLEEGQTKNMTESKTKKNKNKPNKTKQQNL